METGLANKEQKQPCTVLGQVKQYLQQDTVKNRFNEILGKKAPQYMASIVNVINGSKQLQQCVPQTILSAAFVAAGYDLPIDSNLGFSAVVPGRYTKNNCFNAQCQNIRSPVLIPLDMTKTEIQSGFAPVAL